MGDNEFDIWHKNWRDSSSNPEVYQRINDENLSLAAMENKSHQKLEEIARKTNQQLEELKNETMERISRQYDEDMAKFKEEDEQDRINPPLEVIRTIKYKNQVAAKSINKIKIPFKRKKVDIQLSKKTKLVLAGVCAFAVVCGVKAPEIAQFANEKITDNRQDRALEESINSFSKNSVMPHTHDLALGERHTHDYTDIFMNAKLLTEDPFVALYWVYEAIGEDCVNEGMYAFNRIYGTDYIGLNDFLQKNNFNGISEWRKYASDELAREKEAYLDGNNSFGR